MTTISPSRHRHPTSRRCAAHGFTLVETLITVAIAGVLSSVAYPSLESQVMRARRTDAIVALLDAQLGQERFRANHASYGSLAEAGLRASSPGGHYRIAVVSSSAAGFELLASAVAGQTRDAKCRHLRLALVEGTLTYASGSDATTANGGDANRACWSR